MCLCGCEVTAVCVSVSVAVSAFTHKRKAYLVLAGLVGNVLADHTIGQFDRRDRAEQLDLLVAHILGVEGHGRLHRHQRQDLSEMVLHNVADDAEPASGGGERVNCDDAGDAAMETRRGLAFSDRLCARLVESHSTAKCEDPAACVCCVECVLCVSVLCRIVECLDVCLARRA